MRNCQLTHEDYDHMGYAVDLVNNFKVEKVIFNCGEFNDLEKLSWQYSKAMFKYAEEIKGGELNLHEMDEIAKRIIKEQEAILKKYNDGESNKEIDLYSSIFKLN